ncbi:hypothetical protein [uncultured Mycobacterium sp.]|uniref:hypothetical protein n=1 Tax=uncultured Mycobacterium sp. TaxID=171292 RepID=UPI0035CBA87C
MHDLDDDEARSRIAWLAGEDLPADGGIPGGTGFDPVTGWHASLWILNAVYENPELPADMTHHDIHQQAIKAGLRQPTMVGEINLDELTVTTGQSLGFAERPGGSWRRVRWAEIGRRAGFGFWAVSGRWPDLHYLPHEQWEDRAVIPPASCPRIGPTELSSWPVALLPPAEGSLDDESLQALIAVLTDHTPPAALAQCDFYFGCPPLRDGPRMLTGHLREVRSLVDDTGFTPNNMWPADRSWLVYTDYDLCATRISGSTELIAALRSVDNLDSVLCGQP